MRILPGQRRDVDDVAAAALFHCWNGVMTGIKYSVQICFQSLSKLVAIHLLYRLSEISDAGVIDQNIDTAKNAFALLQHHPDLVFAADIADLALRAATTRQVLNCRFEFALI